MRIIVEERLRDFKFWGQARDVARELSSDELDRIEDIMGNEEDPWTDVAINDLFWHDPDTVAQWLDRADWDTLREEKRKENEDGGDGEKLNSIWDELSSNFFQPSIPGHEGQIVHAHLIPNC